MGNMSKIILPSNVLVDILQDLIESVLLLMLEICSNVILDLKIVLEGIKRIDIKDWPIMWENNLVLMVLFVVKECNHATVSQR